MDAWTGVSTKPPSQLRRRRLKDAMNMWSRERYGENVGRIDEAVVEEARKPDSFAHDSAAAASKDAYLDTQESRDAASTVLTHVLQLYKAAPRYFQLT
ncbi:hypothetical protein RvY_14117-2 [Ramazzottius varieornatus]|uniref:Uncharacterized protein n=1 Tax=Ramazzottius varieornatus TaxID=947166 RepID=A0A1D1VQA1_RAMVA|nr:hypothetical protein RvY_14117-2 [Ramazzottius varieornatus]